MVWIDAKVLPKWDVLKRSENGSREPGIRLYFALIGATIYDTPLHGIYYGVRYTTEYGVR